MSIVRIGASIPRTVREWEQVFRKLNDSFRVVDSGVEVTGDNLPQSDALYVTLSSNDSLANNRVLTSLAGQTVINDGGAGSAVTVELADKGDAGTYAKVVTDSKGRVVAGADLAISDMPEPLSWFHFGAGTPNGVVSAPEGHIYINTLGGAGTTLWVKQTGSSNTGWASK